eukprot:1159445-Pelagomonas_calceolata.AAC.4
MQTSTEPRPAWGLQPVHGNYSTPYDEKEDNNTSKKVSQTELYVLGNSLPARGIGAVPVPGILVRALQFCMNRL